MRKCENSCSNNSVSDCLGNAKGIVAVNKDTSMFDVAHCGTAGGLPRTLSSAIAGILLKACQVTVTSQK